jgi:hypothetical protein
MSKNYKFADNYITVNDGDNTLKPIRILLPNPPTLH